MKLSVILFCGVLCLSGVLILGGRHCNDEFLKKQQRFRDGSYEVEVTAIFVSMTLGRIERYQDQCRFLIQKNHPNYNKYLKEKLRICSNKNLTQNLEIYRKANLEAAEFLCSYDTKTLRDLYSREQQCLINSWSVFKECLQRYPLLTITGYSESFCSAANEGLNCVKQSLSAPDCFGEDAERVFTYGYLKTMHSNTPCGSTK